MNRDLIRFCKMYRRKIATHEVVAKFVMLCGKKPTEGIEDNRSLTRKILNTQRKDVFTIYSEEIFSIIADEDKIDLLKFEELLVEISDGVILFLESMGTAAELGAFTFIDKLAKKTLVFVDEKFERNDSFINGGPLAKIKSIVDPNQDDGDVIFSKLLDNSNIDFGNPNIYNKITSFSSNKKLSLSQENFSIDENNHIIKIKPQLLVFFVIDALFVFDYIPKNEVYNCLISVIKDRKYEFKVVFDSNNEFGVDIIQKYIIEMLIKWKIINSKYSVKGNEELLYINFEHFSNNLLSSNFLGKTLFTKSMYDQKEYFHYKLLNRKEITKKFGDVYE